MRTPHRRDASGGKKSVQSAKRRAPLAAVPANSVERYAPTDGAVIARLRSPDDDAAVGNKHSFTVFYFEGQFQFCSARRRSDGQPHLYIAPLRRVFQNCAVGYPSLNLFYPFHYARNNRLFQAVAARRSPSVIRPQKRQAEKCRPYRWAAFSLSYGFIGRQNMPRAHGAAYKYPPSRPAPRANASTKSARRYRLR